MITPTLARLRAQLFDIEDRLAIASRAGNSSPAVLATLQADARTVRAEIADLKRQRLARSAP